MIPLNRIPFPCRDIPPRKNILSEINSGDPLFYIKDRLDGTYYHVYHVNLIDILDRCFMTNSLKYLSPDQERFIEEFFSQAEIKGEAKSRCRLFEMDKVFEDLDDFLGGYEGEDHGRYTR